MSLGVLIYGIGAATVGAYFLFYAEPVWLAGAWGVGMMIVGALSETGRKK